LTAHKPN